MRILLHVLSIWCNPISRLNIYYLILEKMNAFADDSKYDISNLSGAKIESDYEEKRSDAWQYIENLNIMKRIISVCESCYLGFTHSS